MPDKLEQAIEEIKWGDVQEGKRILAEVLAEDPRNEMAWMWLAGAVDTDEQRLYCVKQVLRIDPNNQSARQALASLSGGLVQPGPDATGDQAAGSQPGDEPAASHPVPSGPEMPQSQELVEFVVRELGKHAERNDIVYRICEMTGKDWPQAEAFVHDVETSQRQRIARRQAPLLVIVGLITIVGGAALALPNISFFIQFIQDPAANILYTPYLLRKLAILVVGLGMTAGGIVGILWAIVPSTKGAFPADALGTGSNRYESVDDLVDVGVWLDTAGSASGRARRRGIRLF